MIEAKYDEATGYMVVEDTVTDLGFVVTRPSEGDLAWQSFIVGLNNGLKVLQGMLANG